MDIYKKATKERLRVATDKGLLSVEQLWDLPIATLDSLAVQLEEKYDTSDKKSFLIEENKKDKEIKLSFEITLDILKTKVASFQKASKAYETKKHNARIDELIAKKKDAALESKDIEELEKMRK